MMIAEALKTIRKEWNLLQESIARELNVSFALLNRWENDRVKPNRLAMIALKEFCANNGTSPEIVQAITAKKYTEDRP